MHVTEFNRQNIALKGELEKLMYIQMMVRRRFLSTYKRKKLSIFENFDRHAIQTANQIVHSGDTRLDAMLFRDFGGERTDTDVFKKVYGLTPAQVLRFEYQPTIETINRHASQIASKYTNHYNSQIEASFYKFIKSFADSGFDETYLEKDTATHAAYKEFWHDCQQTGLWRWRWKT
ncbi:uncharacterized protein ASPGLDRAFT_39931 [Aspergillus glaucus CBS 516.65]|uniref:Uncharacterized protein n=1 Tax=Aspergillus glaucus CBS 516.65 TaxID=1160497 RepID=A0A1L9V682_ASPGL|nr:hypothetical protein ASPGLDRAFT_39931 [Aspergillus glaucus CBS 516.65]OJJ79416.1 hypothetical protein ASPGLDRAFT_39931 [Aspergillus glaucus CBS 516.65]